MSLFGTSCLLNLLLFLLIFKKTFLPTLLFRTLEYLESQDSEEILASAEITDTNMKAQLQK